MEKEVLQKKFKENKVVKARNKSKGAQRDQTRNEAQKYAGKDSGWGGKVIKLDN